MIDVYLAYAVYDGLKARRDSFPAKIEGLTVTAVNGRTVVLDAAVPGDWQFGVLEVTDAASDANYLYGVIADASGNVVTLDRRFLKNRAPKVGEKVAVHGGPLGSASFFYGMAPTLNAEIANGYQFFATIEPRQGDRQWATAMGRGLRGKQGIEDRLGYRVTLETPWGVLGTEKEVVHNYIELPLFLHQVAYYIMRASYDQMEGNWVTGTVSWQYQVFGREDFEGPIQGAVVEFDVMAK